MSTPVGFSVEHAHMFSFKNEAGVNKAEICSCYHCLSKFTPEDIVEWHDGGNTAVCPECEIDSVLSFDVATDILVACQERWFGESVDRVSGVFPVYKEV